VSVPAALRPHGRFVPCASTTTGSVILYIVASVVLFSMQNATGKWLAHSYPIPMLVLFRSAAALLPSYLLVMHAVGSRSCSPTGWARNSAAPSSGGGSNALRVRLQTARAAPVRITVG
jgi:hypothetical protein